MPREFEKFARGVDVAVDGKYVIVRIDTDPDKGIDSSTGTMSLTASTAGFRPVDGTKQFRVSVMGGYKNGR
jgi:hypothetical protein